MDAGVQVLSNMAMQLPLYRSLCCMSVDAGVQVLNDIAMQLPLY